MENELSCNVSIFIENDEDKKTYVARCEELNMSDFGDSPEEALENLKLGINLLLESDPSKKQHLIKEKPLMTTRLLL